MGPRSVVLHAVSRELEIGWEDGSISRYPYSWLRRHCRCAECTAARRTGNPPPSSAAAVSITGCEPQGHYAIQLTFDDGHYRGIYPWAYLREIDPAGIA